MKTRELTVYIMGSCIGCARARELAAEVKLRVPGRAVHVIDLEDEGAVHPPEVFSVPTWMLDGRIISLGNPDIRDITTMLEGGLGGDHDARHPN